MLFSYLKPFAFLADYIGIVSPGLHFAMCPVYTALLHPGYRSNDHGGRSPPYVANQTFKLFPLRPSRLCVEIHLFLSSVSGRRVGSAHHCEWIVNNI